MRGCVRLFTKDGCLTWRKENVCENGWMDESSTPIFMFVFNIKRGKRMCVKMGGWMDEPSTPIFIQSTGYSVPYRIEQSISIVDDLKYRLQKHNI